MYLRLLGRGVDSVAASSIGEAAGGALGQQRLLIPVILVLFYNRCAMSPKHCVCICYFIFELVHGSLLDASGSVVDRSIECRYNTLYSDQMGLHLELLPMLIGAHQCYHEVLLCPAFPRFMLPHRFLYHRVPLMFRAVKIGWTVSFSCGCSDGDDWHLFDAGFFTYKAGVVGKTSLALFRELSGGGKEKS